MTIKNKDKIIAELKAENETLKKVKDFACINLQNYIADNNKLKAENERLKAELKNNKAAYEVELGTYNMECGNLLEENKQLLQTLQEIKEIADALSCKHPEDCWENKPDWNGEVYGCDVADNWKNPSELATCPSKLASAILQIITKAESEG